ncbi:hypothetical protein L6J37_04300 [Photobacterium sp. WH77]|uniref:hypothetical protein n=1 Tax=unclassified Photobacterium TaxID=2628852 RepID=UPI001EDBC07C|nr:MULTISPECIES: hypothetical protein [unclassified Photobacterium]MCG2836081.1 hypothetical protein [Photobacterium sp. WH77]MCG2843782.1 hypothetical protein [Photobacterium sp. WH80]MDO6583632.1 hypothetical protein [Photobacterium sp. 2_MG-2023]
MSDIWQDTCVGILLYSAVSFSPVLNSSLSPERLFQASREASQYNGEAWQHLLNPAVLTSLPEQTAGLTETVIMGLCRGEQGGQIIWQIEPSEL